jgi:hypothetical protein
MDEDDIRAPDKVIKETLMDPELNDYNEEKMLEHILQQSMMEFEKNTAIHEDNVIQFIAQEEKKRLDFFVSIKQKINKILRFDKQNTQIYEEILNIIALYEDQYITIYNCNKEEYTNIFSILNTIRLTKEEIDKMNKLFICE